MSLWLSGNGVSRGIAMAAAQVLGAAPPVPERAIAAAEIEAEVLRLLRAVDLAGQQLRALRARIPNTASDIVAFVDLHLLLVQDQRLGSVASDHIRERCCNAEAALARARDALLEGFDGIEDAYLRSRRQDIEQVCERILAVLAGSAGAGADISSGREAGVVVAHDLSAADILILQHRGMVGLVTESGGPLSHAAILTRSLGMPAVMGVHDACRLVEDGELLVIDGERGFVLVAPDAAAQAFFLERQHEARREREHLGMLREQPARTRDGVRVQLLVNIERPEDAVQVEAQGADGVGLYRTEFLYMNRSQPPDEEEQYEAYASVLRVVSGPVTVRTFDLGADKPAFAAAGGSVQTNPALGLRGVRLSLREQALFKVQLRALLRASAHGNLRIMLPMVSGVPEMRQVRRLLERCAEELRAEGCALAPRVPLGAMIEVPAAAIEAPRLAAFCDFFSIGTNDLIQYTLAIDRSDEDVHYLYDPLQPAVLNLIAGAVAAGRAAGIPVALCGEMAGEARHTGLLLGLGLRELSMQPGSVPEVKRMVLDSDMAALAALAPHSLRAVTDYARTL